MILQICGQHNFSDFINLKIFWNLHRIRVYKSVLATALKKVDIYVKDEGQILNGEHQ